MPLRAEEMTLTPKNASSHYCSYSVSGVEHGQQREDLSAVDSVVVLAGEAAVSEDLAAGTGAELGAVLPEDIMGPVQCKEAAWVTLVDTAVTVHTEVLVQEALVAGSPSCFREKGHDNYGTCPINTDLRAEDIPRPANVFALRSSNYGATGVVVHVVVV